jgi:hypothetical protein
MGGDGWEQTGLAPGSIRRIEGLRDISGGHRRRKADGWRSVGFRAVRPRRSDSCNRRRRRDNVEMLVVPLFLADPPGGPDASHRICAPGGYEFWRVSAVDDAKQISLKVGFFDGHPSLPAYLRQYRRYRRKPTANAPPIPHDFQVVEIDVNAPIARMVHHVEILPAGSVRASSERLEIFAGSHALRRNTDGALELQLAHPRCQAELIFVPQSATTPAVVRCENGEFIFDADPQYVVHGTIQFEAPAAVDPHTIQFSGRGSHEHRWCAAPGA